jgi:hypothetical protein
MRPWVPDSGAVRATDGGGTGHGREQEAPRTRPGQATDGAEKSTDGSVGAVTLTAPPGFVALTWHFRVPLAAVISLFTGLALGPAVLGAASGDEVANADISGTRAEHEATESVG